MVLRRALIAAVWTSVAYLCLVAAFSWVPPVWWFGRPGSVATEIVVGAGLTAVCVSSYRTQDRERPGARPAGVMAILLTSSAALAFSSFSRCHDPKNLPFVSAIVWALGTVRGRSQGYSAANGCPRVTPVALDIAAIAGSFVLYVGLIAIFVSVFSTEVDRMRVQVARSVTAVVDFDNDSRSLVTAVARAVRKDKSQLALIVSRGQLNAVRDLRAEGARVIVTDLDKLGSLELLPLWKKTRQLYLLTASPTTNLHRLAAIEARLRAVTNKQRLPLIVRIDDPWQAESWRAQRLGGSDPLWGASALGIYEVTAERLLDRIIATGQTTRVITCGTSGLTLALCADLRRRQIERGYYTAPNAPELPSLTIVAKNADEYRKDIDVYHRALGYSATDQWLTAVNELPAFASLVGVIKPEDDGGPAKDGEAGARRGDKAQTQPPDGEPATGRARAGADEGDTNGSKGLHRRARTLTQAWKLIALRASQRWQTPSRPAAADQNGPAVSAVTTGEVTAHGDGHRAADEPGHAPTEHRAQDALESHSPPGPDTENHGAAVIFALPAGQAQIDAMLGTRLAARFPTMPIFVQDPKIDPRQDTIAPLAGQLHTFRLAMNVPYGRGHDPWERAAMLIHERYAAQAGHDSDVTKPWAELDEFYRGSNRRVVRNTLWMVEKIARHTWDAYGTAPDEPVSAELTQAAPLQRLAVIGFDRDTAMAMAEAEHEDWARYLRRYGWRYGPTRDNTRKRRPDLVPWATLVSRSPEKVDGALDFLATTLYSLRELGLRSRPLWQRYRRIGDVTAKRHIRGWTWTTRSGEAMRARAGDWEVTDGDGSSWPLRNKAFRSSYAHLGENRWRPKADVFARAARDGEIVGTVLGQSVATASDWVVEGCQGERWVVPGDEFARHYQPSNPDATPAGG
ncbi:hypothetical protein MPRM_37610 [Mycobacterium parmense]|uniref:Ryanodine receptor Ryr domain-containing protein n=2 Tax=Mycobacterium parmense TaxID=185642 RepID=A0A7I7YXK2_9MYCO|nr:hypothetical protein MPRM_37610 [Mycobacterium parmense]